MAYISQSKTSLSLQDRNYLLKERDRRIIQSESPQGKAGEDVGQPNIHMPWHALTRLIMDERGLFSKTGMGGGGLDVYLGTGHKKRTDLLTVFNPQISQCPGQRFYDSSLRPNE